MKFHEHIIRVTVPELGFVVKREDLVKGLANYARHPEHYLEEVTGSEVTTPETRGSEPGSIAFGRDIHFGNISFHEDVELGPDGSYRAHVDGDGTRPSSDFSMQIEEPETGSLFIRFIYYEDREADPHESVRDQQVAYLRRLAYESKDRSIVTQMLSDIADQKASQQS